MYLFNFLNFQHHKKDLQIINIKLFCNILYKQFYRLNRTYSIPIFIKSLKMCYNSFKYKKKADRLLEQSIHLKTLTLVSVF